MFASKFKNWWRYEDSVYVRYHKIMPGMCPVEGRTSKFFIDRAKNHAHAMANGPWKYCIFGAGMHPGGCAALVDGANTLKEAIAKAEAIEVKAVV